MPGLRTASDGPEALLPGCVPYLQLDLSGAPGGQVSCSVLQARLTGKEGLAGKGRAHPFALKQDLFDLEVNPASMGGCVSTQGAATGVTVLGNERKEGDRTQWW